MCCSWQRDPPVVHACIGRGEWAYDTAGPVLEGLLHGRTAVHSQHGYTEQIQLKSGRSFVLHTPTPTRPHDDKPGALLFAHGARGWAWDHALRVTRWPKLCAKQASEGDNFVVAFLQAQWKGPPEAVASPPSYGVYESWTSFPRRGYGEFYWGIREPELSEEVEYVQEVIDAVDGYAEIDRRLIYFYGHSNGGIFACNLAIRMGNTFAAVGCSMGGWRGHMDPELAGYVEIKEDTRQSLPVLIVTGDADTYREPCERARYIFSFAGHQVSFIVLPNTGHRYQHHFEAEVWDFFRAVALPVQLSTLWVTAAALRRLGCKNIEAHAKELTIRLSQQPELIADLRSTGIMDTLVQHLVHADGTDCIHSIQLASTLLAAKASHFSPSSKMVQHLLCLMEQEGTCDEVRDSAAVLLGLCAAPGISRH